MLPAGTGLLVTPNTGGSVQFVDDDLLLLGRAGVVTNAANANTIEIGDNRNYTPYIVGPDGPSLTSDNPSEFGTIAGAIAQAIADGATVSSPAFVWVKPGLYQEDITLDGSVVLQGENFSSTAIQGQVTITGMTNPSFIQHIQGLTLIQTTGRPVLNVPAGSMGQIVCDQCFAIQTDPTVAAIDLVTPNANDNLVFIFSNGAILGVFQSPVSTLVNITGNGRIEFQMVYAGIIFGIVNNAAINVGQSPFDRANELRFINCFLTEAGATSVGNTQTYLLSCNVDNSNTNTIVTNCLGYLNVLSSRLTNAQFTIPVAATGILRGNIVYNRNAFPLITCAGDVYAGSNFVRNTTSADWMVGAGTYHVELGSIGAPGTNVFEAGSLFGNTIATQVNAQMG